MTSFSEFWKTVETRSEERVFSLLAENFLKENRPVAETIGKLLLTSHIGQHREALLHCVDVGECELTEILLDRLKQFGLAEDQPCSCSDLYLVHFTPLILASLTNNFEMVCLLLNRGHFIKIPHRADCACKLCSEERKTGENVERKMERIDTYRALSSSAYLWLSNEDPILFSLKLARELEKCAAVEKQFKDQYEELSERVKKFALKVVEQCRTEDEVHSLLARKEGIPLCSAEFPLPRLTLALNSLVTDFLADVNIQTEVDVAWLGGWADWDVRPPYYNLLLRIIPHTLLYPITSILYIFSGGRLFNTYRYPFARCLSYLTSYTLFLISLLLATQAWDERSLRGFTKNTVKSLLLSYAWLYLLGMMWFDYLSFTRKGFRRFFANWWNWLNTLLWSVLCISFYCFVRAELQANTYEVETVTFDRKTWVWWDSQLVAESFFAGGTILAILKIFYFLQLSRKVGPTVISLGRCSIIVSRYLVIMIVVIFSFAVGLKYIYYGYAGYSAVVSETEPWATLWSGSQTKGQLVTQPPHFLTLPSSMWSLYWGFYGYLPPTYEVIVMENMGVDQSYREEGGHWFTGFVGELTVVTYHIVLLIVLMNLMIAMMVTMTTYVVEHEDIEWKFIRCHVRSEFFEESNCVPPPFNMIHWLVSWIWVFIHQRNKIRFSWPDLAYLEPNTDYDEDKKYKNLMIALFERFICKEVRYMIHLHFCRPVGRHKYRNQKNVSS